MQKPSPRFLRIIFNISLVLNLMLIPYVFLSDHIVHYMTRDHSFDWITKPILNSSLYKSIYQVKKTDPQNILKLYQLMKDVHEIFEKNQIQYWAGSGTLLGAVRHQGIIPWDGDIDIEMLFEDGFRFQKMIPEFEKLGYEVDEAYFGYKILLVENKSDRNHNIGCDIFLIAKDGDKYIFYSPEARKRWPAYISKEELYPLKKCRFGELEIWCPKAPELYLTRLYGKWETVAYQQEEDHLTAEEKPRIPFTPTEKDLEPAKPTGPLKDRVDNNIV